MSILVMKLGLLISTNLLKYKKKKRYELISMFKELEDS